MIKYIHIYILLMAILGMSSCTYNDIPVDIIPEIKDGEAYVQIHMNLPDLKTIQEEKSSTRAMDDKAERYMSLDNLSVLVFKQDGADEKFVYKAPLSGELKYDDADPTKATVTMKLVRSVDSNEKFRFVVIANHSIDAGILNKGDTKATVLSKLTFNVTGRWNARSGSSTPFPMWGETETLLVVSKDMAAQTIKMRRALARIDVGLNFGTDSNNNLSEVGAGVGNFMIKGVNVYRTYDKGNVAPLNGINSPSVPSDAGKHDDSAPVNYKITTPTGENQYVREIYVPEAGLPSSAGNDNMHCIVVSGYYNGSSTETFYRLDFATETETTNDRDYMPILRNHRYVFNITEVRGPGFVTADAALKSTATINKVGYELITWDESISNVEVQGKYFFGINQSDIQLAPQANSEITIDYQTNLLSTEPITLEWKNGAESVFTATKVSGANKKITIKTNSENVTNKVIVDTLIVKAGPFEKRIHVEQKYVNFKYFLNCESVTVHGTYTNGTQLTANHYINVTITPEDETIIGKQYKLVTRDLAGAHGITFEATGTFTSTAPIPVKLVGSGTVAHDPAEGPFTLRIESNSSSGSFCEATINTISDTLNIVTLGDMNAHGYNISYVGGGSNKILTATNNFGPNENSIVKVQGFKFTNTIYYDLSSNKTTDAYKLITGTGEDKKLADIVYMCYPLYVPLVNADAVANILVEYMRKGGVIVGFFDANATSEYLAVALTKKVLGKSTITSVNSGGGGSVYPFPLHPIYTDVMSTENIIKLRSRYQNDPILDGPFGDVRDKQWGDDAGITVNLRGMPSEEEDPNLRIYSYHRNIGFPLETPLDDVNAYKYESDDKNLVFFGDGGFTSSPSGVPTASTTLYPLYWNTTTFYPIPKPSFGANKQYPVYNSVVFCNIMAWAIDKSESLRSKRIANSN